MLSPMTTTPPPPHPSSSFVSTTTSSFPFYSSSLTLRLLRPWEYLVTVNHSSLWQKHVAWAKPDGAHLKQYITGHYSSNMVLLSLLLTACLNIFFNSSQELSHLRQALGGHGWKTTTTEEAVFPPHVSSFPPLTFWIGLLLLCDIFVTLMGLVATFTLWGMISAISDANAHCLLRSSLGQYAMSLPPRLVVASLYIFLLWSSLFVLELVLVQVAWMLVASLVVLFLGAIVIPLSALGRLIVDAGGMAQTPILPLELEQQLLPSGLQASLLLRALHRQQKQKQQSAAAAAAGEQGQPLHPDNHPEEPDDIVSSQYRRKRKHQRQTRVSRNDEDRDRVGFGSTPATTGAGDSNINYNRPPRASPSKPAAFSATTRQVDDDALVGLFPFGDDQNATSTSAPSSPMKRTQHHRRSESGDTMASDYLWLPRASVLNSAVSKKQLYDLVESSLSTTTRAATSSQRNDRLSSNVNDGGSGATAAEILKEDKAQDAADVEAPLPPTSATTHSSNMDDDDLLQPLLLPSTPTIQRPSALSQHHRRASSTATALLAHEWTQDAHVREMYGAAMPAEIPMEEIEFENASRRRSYSAWSLSPWWSASTSHLEVEPPQGIGITTPSTSWDHENPPNRTSVAPNSTDISRRWVAAAADELRQPLLSNPTTPTSGPTATSHDGTRETPSGNATTPPHRPWVAATAARHTGAGFSPSSRSLTSDDDDDDDDTRSLLQGEQIIEQPALNEEEE